MAPPPRIRSITRESIPGAPAWMDSVLPMLNEGLSQTAFALARGLTFGENFRAELKEVSLQAPAPRWIAPTFQNSWVDFGSTYQTAGYTMDSLGFVRLRGFVKSGTLPGTIFTLPAGFRPPADQHFAISSNTAYGEANVVSDGRVIANAGNNTNFSLNGINFQAATPCAFVPTPEGFPRAVKHSLPFVAGVLPVACRCLESLQNGGGGVPSVDWERAADGTIRLKNVHGLAPGRKYKLTLLLFAG